MLSAVLPSPRSPGPSRKNLPNPRSRILPLLALLYSHGGPGRAQRYLLSGPPFIRSIPADYTTAPQVVGVPPLLILCEQYPKGAPGIPWKHTNRPRVHSTRARKPRHLTFNGNPKNAMTRRPETLTTATPLHLMSFSPRKRLMVVFFSSRNRSTPFGQTWELPQFSIRRHVKHALLRLGKFGHSTARPVITTILSQTVPHAQRKCVGFSATRLLVGKRSPRVRPDLCDCCRSKRSEGNVR